MNSHNFILFTDGTWCFETELPLHEDKGSSYLKLPNPFAPTMFGDPRCFEKPKKPVINVFDFDVTHNKPTLYGPPFVDSECRLRFVSSEPIAVGTSIDTIEVMGVTFYDTRVTEISFMNGEAIYVGYPRHWVETK